MATKENKLIQNKTQICRGINKGQLISKQNCRANKQTKCTQDTILSAFGSFFGRSYGATTLFWDLLIFSNGQIYLGDFAKFCGLLRIYEIHRSTALTAENEDSELADCMANSWISPNSEESARVSLWRVKISVINKIRTYFFERQVQLFPAFIFCLLGRLVNYFLDNWSQVLNPHYFFIIEFALKLSIGGRIIFVHPLHKLTACWSILLLIIKSRILIEQQQPSVVLSVERIVVGEP